MDLIKEKLRQIQENNRLALPLFGVLVLLLIMHFFIFPYKRQSGRAAAPPEEAPVEQAQTPPPEEAPAPEPEPAPAPSPEPEPSPEPAPPPAEQPHPALAAEPPSQSQPAPPAPSGSPSGLKSFALLNVRSQRDDPFRPIVRIAASAPREASPSSSGNKASKPPPVPLPQSPPRNLPAPDLPAVKVHPKPQPPQVKVTGVMVDDDPVAFAKVNGEERIVKKGDVVGGYRVVKVDGSGVVLRQGSHTIMAHLAD